MKRLLLIALTIAGFAASGAHPAERVDAVTVETANVAYRNSVAQARAGKTAEAFVTLRALVARPVLYG